MPVDDEAVEIHKSLHHVLGMEGGRWQEVRELETEGADLFPCS
jgi:hypothetical protein